MSWADGVAMWAGTAAVTLATVGGLWEFFHGRSPLAFVLIGVVSAVNLVATHRKLKSRGVK